MTVITYESGVQIKIISGRVAIDDYHTIRAAGFRDRDIVNKGCATLIAEIEAREKAKG